MSGRAVFLNQTQCLAPWKFITSLSREIISPKFYQKFRVNLWILEEIRQFPSCHAVFSRSSAASFSSYKVLKYD